MVGDGGQLDMLHIFDGLWAFTSLIAMCIVYSCSTLREYHRGAHSAEDMPHTTDGLLHHIICNCYSRTTTEVLALCKVQGGE